MVPGNCMQILISSSFITAKIKKKKMTAECIQTLNGILLSGNWIELPISTETWINLQSTMLSERSQSPKWLVD